MLTHISIQYKKQHPYINITNNHNVLRNCQPRRGKYKFSKILNCTWKLEFYNWQQLLSVIFPWSGKLISFIFETVSAKCPNLDNSPLSVFEVRIIFHEKRGSFSSQCNLSHESLSSRRPSYLSLQQNCFMHFPTLSHRIRISKRHALKVQYLIHWIIFSASSKTFLSQTGFFLSASVWWWETQSVTPITADATASFTLKHQQFYPHLLLHHQCKFQHRKKRNNNIFVLIRK